ncbi:MAG TPA: hypothetical protein VK524_08770 [Polyangiaceae bacterium]|nr:hypothetical protein [Polyangiaceae bacterium]
MKTRHAAFGIALLVSGGCGTDPTDDRDLADARPVSDSSAERGSGGDAGATADVSNGGTGVRDSAATEADAPLDHDDGPPLGDAGLCSDGREMCGSMCCEACYACYESDNGPRCIPLPCASLSL